MGRYANEIIDVCNTLNYKASLLTYEDAKSVLNLINKKFSSPDLHGYAFWDRVPDSAGVYNDQAWLWIGDFVGSYPILVFFDDDTSVVRIEDGLTFPKIYAECVGFVFYLTNLNFDYLICFNDHDILIGAGTAKKWIENKQNKIH
jgi:thiol-disulfide isomerase/thioredoxin